MKHFKILIAGTLIFCGSLFSVKAQGRYYANDSLRNNYSTYFGLQANQLFKQFLSFNSSTSINTNPFLLTFSKNNGRGKGFAMGTGLNFSVESSNDGTSLTEITNRNFVFRIGYEAKYHLGERWIPFWGIDFHVGGVYSKIFTQQAQSFQINSSTVTSTNLFFGPAVRGGVLVALSKYLYLGTEGFFNFKLAFQETTVATSNNNSGIIFPGSSTTRSIPINFGINVPTAIFMMVKF